MDRPIQVEKHPDFRTIIVSGVFGGHRPGYFEAITYTDELVADEALATPVTDPTKAHGKRTIQCRLYFDPLTAKSIAAWLNGHVADYEKEFGAIKTPAEPPQKGRATYT
jgi:hypothetical protein